MSGRQNTCPEGRPSILAESECGRIHPNQWTSDSVAIGSGKPVTMRPGSGSECTDSALVAWIIPKDV